MSNSALQTNFTTLYLGFEVEDLKISMDNLKERNIEMSLIKQKKDIQNINLSASIVKVEYYTTNSDFH